MRKLSTIAREILDSPTLKGNSRYYAEAYVVPMLSLDTIEDNYYLDSGESIVIYALSNLTFWRGEQARTIKAELKSMLPSHYA